jgi:hypothetical protein
MFDVIKMNLVKLKKKEKFLTFCLIWKGVSRHCFSVQVPGQRLSHLQRTDSQDISRGPLLFSTRFLSVRNPRMHSDIALPSHGEARPRVSLQTPQSSTAAELFIARQLPQLIWDKKQTIEKEFNFFWWQSIWVDARVNLERYSVIHVSHYPQHNTIHRQTHQKITHHFRYICQRFTLNYICIAALYFTHLKIYCTSPSLKTFVNSLKGCMHWREDDVN